MLNRWLWLSALVILLDQSSKLWITSRFAFGESLRVLGVFDLVLAHNTGAAFSFLHDAGGMQRWLFSIIAIAASVWIVWVLRRAQHETLFSRGASIVLRAASAPAWIAPLPLSNARWNYTARRFTCATRWYTTSSWWMACVKKVRCSSRIRPMCRPAAFWCSARTACRSRCGAKEKGAG